MTPKNNYQNEEQDRRLTDLENHWIILNSEFGCIKTNVEWLTKQFGELQDKIDELFNILIGGFIVVIIAQVILKFFL